MNQDLNRPKRGKSCSASKLRYESSIFYIQAGPNCNNKINCGKELSLFVPLFPLHPSMAPNSVPPPAYPVHKALGRKLTVWNVDSSFTPLEMARVLTPQQSTDERNLQYSPGSLNSPVDVAQDAERGLVTFSLAHNQHHRQQSHQNEPTHPLPAYFRGPNTSSTPREHQCGRGGSHSTSVTSNKSESHDKSETESENQIPPTRYRRAWLNVLRWEWLSVYRRLNIIVIAFNLVIIIALAARGLLPGTDPGVVSIGLAANILIAVAFRQEYVVNLLFVLFGLCRPSWPLWIRGLAAKIYHFGGVHSGAGFASVIWLAFFDAALGLHYYRTAIPTGRDIAIITIAAVLNFLLFLIVCTAHPKVRDRCHNTWELIHRFGGWTAVGLFWANFGLIADGERQKYRPDETVYQLLITQPVFWMLLVTTLCLIAPWLRLRKVDVFPEPQSRHAIRLHFLHHNLPLCSAPRLSTSPLMEWHAFAGIPEASGVGFSVLVSGAGDWTRNLVANPPRKLWTRGIPVRGVLHVAPMFKKIVIVATGSGIGPVLSLLYARALDCRILWATRDPLETYKPNILEEVLRADPNAKIIKRTRGQQDPDIGFLAYELYRESKAEAVFIISNRQGCYSGRTWLESRGVLVFTPIFDS